MRLCRPVSIRCEVSTSVHCPLSTLRLNFGAASTVECRGVSILFSFATMTDVKIDVEYCGSCGHKKEFVEMAKLIKSKVPNAKISGSAGRQASFEIHINGELVYSKLQTMAFPNFLAVSDLAAKIEEGKPMRKIVQQQPIDCSIV